MIGDNLRCHASAAPLEGWGTNRGVTPAICLSTPKLYRLRNIIERTFWGLKDFRGCRHLLDKLA
jgi:hypothetical protein